MVKSVIIAILESPLVFRCKNYTEGLRYLAMAYSPGKLALIGLRRVTPVRRLTKRTIPGVTNVNYQKMEDNDNI